MESMEQEPLEPGSSVPAVREPDLRGWAEQLVSAASDRGIALTGEDGLLTALTRQVLQTALEVEMSRSSRAMTSTTLVAATAGTPATGRARRRVTTEIGRSRSRCRATGTAPSNR